MTRETLPMLCLEREMEGREGGHRKHAHYVRFDRYARAKKRSTTENITREGTANKRLIWGEGERRLVADHGRC